MHHPHIHCVVPAGGFAPGRTQWVSPKRAGFFLPSDVLSDVFRGKFHDGLKQLFRRNQLALHGSLIWLREPRSFARFLHTLHSHPWVVDVRKPFGGPEHVLHYLARYTHRVAISNHRLIRLENGQVTFRWKDYAHGGKKRKMTLAAEEFIRRFLLHVLPKGFTRIRYYGWMANRCRRQRAAECRALLAAEPMLVTAAEPPPTVVHSVVAPSKSLISPFLAGCHVAGAAGDVNWTPRNISFLLANHTGRGARIFEVCRYADSRRKIILSLLNLCLSRSSLTGESRFPAPLRTALRMSIKYQNDFRSTYRLVPRPPQTQAAHFKRLYRK
jgi:hypothetical protein